MFIKTEATPNPETIKFLPGIPLYEGGTYEAQSLEDAAASPLAQRLFAIQGVTRVFIAHDFVSVTKADDTDWVMLKSLVLAGLMEHISTGMPIINLDMLSQGPSEDDDEITLQIKELLDTRVRPAVAMDGGDITFERFEDGIVFLRMQGACAGCPSSTMTLKMGIENMLKSFIPEVEEVRPVELY